MVRLLVLQTILFSLTVGQVLAEEPLLDSLLSLRERERADAIADALLEADAPLSSKVISYYLFSTGLHGELDAEGKQTQQRSARKMRLVTSKDSGYASFFMTNPHQIATPFTVIVHAGTTRQYFYDASESLIQLTVGGKTEFPMSQHLQAFCELTNASCASDAPNRFISLQKRCDFYRRLNWGGTKNIPGIGRVLVLQSSEPLEDFHATREEHFFGERFDQLVYLGRDQLIQEKSRRVDKGERVIVNKWTSRIQYDRHNGFVLPSHLDTQSSQETFDFNMQQLIEPHTFWDLGIRVVKSEVMDEFPESLLAIEVPPITRVLDLTSDE